MHHRQWRAAIYAGSDDPRQPPILALGFKDEKAGVEIFEGWRARQQETRETDFVRVAILTGIDKPAPYAYTMIIGAEVSAKTAKASHAHKAETFKRPKLRHGVLTIEGTDANDKIALRLQAGDAIVFNAVESALSPVSGIEKLAIENSSCGCRQLRALPGRQFKMHSWMLLC